MYTALVTAKHESPLAQAAIKQLQALAQTNKARDLTRFFKTGPGEYGEGDQFLGVMVPQIRKIAKELARKADLDDLHELLSSHWHEVRLLALLIMVYQYPKITTAGQASFFEFYLGNTSRINNWDLVDLSSPYIVGQYLLSHEDPWTILERLAKSRNIWERRIAMVASAAFIRKNQFEHTLRLAKELLGDSQELIHKASGWMLREVGKRDREELIKFLDQNIKEISATTLSYATEHFSQEARKKYQELRRLARKQLKKVQNTMSQI